MRYLNWTTLAAAVVLLSSSVLVWAASNFTLTVMPPAGGNPLACDFGPNTTFPTGMVGADLTAAGFTHCALNADFTDASGITSGASGWKMTDKNTWLNQCKGTHTWGLLWLMFTYGNVANGDRFEAPCNRAVITTDGTQVLEFTFNPSDINTTLGGSGLWGMGIYWPICGDVCQNTLGLVTGLSNFHYTEITYRISAGLFQTADYGNNTLVAFEEDGAGANYQGPGCCDNDHAYLEAGSNNAGTHSGMDSYQVDNGCPSNKCSNGFFYNNPAQRDMGNFHTQGFLTTGDANMSAASCFYYDGGNPAPKYTVGAPWVDDNVCSAWVNQQPGTVHNNYKFIHGICLCPPQPNVAALNTVPVTMHLRSIRVFDCSSTIGTICSTAQTGGTVVNH